MGGGFTPSVLQRPQHSFELAAVHRRVALVVLELLLNFAAVCKQLVGIAGGQLGEALADFTE
jgi:hypothetical protein